MMTGTVQGVRPGDVDARALRNAFGSFLTGVTVVTTVDAAGIPRGLTANSYTSVSLDPPLILVCIDHKAASYQTFAEAPGFAVNILGEQHKAASNLFASKSADKFAQFPLPRSTDGMPVVPDALCWMDCSTHQRIQAGDHMVLIGEVRAFQVAPGTPLGYCRGSYLDFGLVRTVAAPHGAVMVGCIAEIDGLVLLQHDPGSDTWSVPHAHPSSHAHPMGELPAMLARHGVDVALSFLFSVFQAPASSRQYVVYRGAGRLRRALSPNGRLALFDADNLPWDRLQMPQMASMLRRYFHERDNDRFGVYMDSSDGGRVAMQDGSVRSWADYAATVNRNRQAGERP
jgi:flavin reductase (DIM6/NTAB) family NADH-FMN oxidoreductase RutF